ncbi:MAG TPA: dephospho-CoA kinase [Acidimicrobiales bacterium]|nr:dephospho-CoA kinase [Acidimicrobiales bacterium]
MLVVGLTGGIGSGKSTVSAMLAGKGAVVVDADAITREVQQPGTPVFAAMVERFGPAIVAADGTLDREAVADIVFGDGEALADLNAIVHPAVGAEIMRRMQELAETDAVVVLDVPLMVESKRGYPLAGLLVVDVDPEVAVERLVAQRGMREHDVRARMARQASRDERTARADRIIDNSGDFAALASQVDAAWRWIEALPRREQAPAG